MPFAIQFLLVFALSVGWSSFLTRKDQMVQGLKKKFLNSPIIVMVAGPVLEELLHRLIPILLGATSIFDWSMLISSLLFALLHMPNYREGHVVKFIKFFGTACILAWVALNWGIMYAILMHMMHNMLTYSILYRNRHSFA